MSIEENNKEFGLYKLNWLLSKSRIELLKIYKDVHKEKPMMLDEVFENMYKEVLYSKPTKIIRRIHEYQYKQKTN